MSIPSPKWLRVEMESPLVVFDSVSTNAIKNSVWKIQNRFLIDLEKQGVFYASR
jgi:hypothetical protein